MRTALLLLFLAVPAPAQEVPTFAAGTEAVYLDTFVERDGVPVADLTAADFEVKDEGAIQAVELVERGQVPLHAILLLDTSASVAGEPLRSLQAAAGAFLERLRPTDRVSVVTFADRARLLGGLAQSPAAAIAAVSSATAAGTTALHDALVLAATLADPRHGRGVLLLFSDGRDRLSFLPAEEAQQAVRESAAVVYVVDPRGAITTNRPGINAYEMIGATDRSGSSGQVFDLPSRYARSIGDAQPHVYKEASPAFMKALAEDNGGEVISTGATRSLGDAFTTVLAQLQSRYLFHFEPTSSTPGWHRLEVKVKGRRGTAHARRGYRVVAP